MKKRMMQLSLPAGTVVIALLLLITRFVNLHIILENAIMVAGLALMGIGFIYIVSCLAKKQNPYDRYSK